MYEDTIDSYDNQMIWIDTRILSHWISSHWISSYVRPLTVILSLPSVFHGVSLYTSWCLLFYELSVLPPIMCVKQYIFCDTKSHTKE